MPRQIANAHTLINVAAALIFLPFLGGYERVLRRLVRAGKDEATQPRYLDPALLDTPSVALAQAAREALRMGDTVTETVRMALAALSTWDRGLALETAQRKETGNQRLAELHVRHLNRLKQGLKESIDTSTIHLDFISDLERTNFHASAIGRAIAECVMTHKRWAAT